MTAVLGLHFGHDATVTVLVDGQIEAFVQRERLSRIKHAYSLDRETLNAALSQCSLSPGSIDVVAVTSTQGCEPILINFPGIFLEYDLAMAIGSKPLLDDYLGNPQDVTGLCAKSMIERVLGPEPDPDTHPAFHHYFAEYKGIPFDKLRRFPWLDAHVELPSWRRPPGLKTLASLDISRLLGDARCRFGFHYPLRVSLDGRVIPGVRVDHHLAHAASSFYRSGAKEALVLTNDGYGGRKTSFANGGVYLGLDRDLVPLSPHFLTHGNLYDAVSRFIGLPAVGGSGRLMGLAPYGVPAYFDSKFIGDSLDHILAGIDGSPAGWIAHCRRLAADAEDHGRRPLDADLPFSLFAINLAASTQKLFEETWLALIEVSRCSLAAAGHRTENLCLSGGAALNCPSNARIHRECGFGQVFIEPNCDDGGLSIGAALWVYHALLQNAVHRSAPFRVGEVYGAGYPKARLEKALASHETLRAEKPIDPAGSAAADLVSGLVVAWFEGGSEMGPRALGHRSVLADPRSRAMHYRVNFLKNREVWRPLAPMVLKDSAPEHFDLRRLPLESPFMLLTAPVLNSSLAAITHADGSARLQTVTPANGLIFDVLREFQARTGIPVLINTSMNGPGEPIAETPDDALAFLLRGCADVLYLEGRRIARVSR